MSAPKIIVLGSLNGQLEPALNKVAALHAKNNFSLAILTGEVFPPSADDETITALLNGSIEVPLPTYFTVGNHPLPPRVAARIQADEEICPNLHYLGKRSVTKTSEGLRIVALGGLLDPNIVAGQSKEQHLPFHSADDAKSLRGANNADILLTSMWPANVWNRSHVALDAAHQSGVPSSADIAELCAALKPRYHLSASSDAFFYEREPFISSPATESSPAAVTRFISMAPLGNASKAKAMYAFTLNKTDTAVPTGATPSPFSVRQQNKRPRNDDQSGASFSRYGRHDDTRHGGGRRNKRQRANSPPPGPDRCYFCLSNPNLSSHMCCSIGDDAYLTTAKGPLPPSDFFAEQGLDFPGHFLIIPLPHAPTIASMGSTQDPSGDAVKALAEMERFRESLQAMISAKSAHALGAVTWEISRARNVHLIWQLIAVPRTLISNGMVEAAFKVEAQNLEYQPFTGADALSVEDLAQQGDFFRIWLWADDGEDKVKGKSLVMPLRPEARFDLQFGRRVLAKLMGLDARFSWQACEQSTQEEIKDVEAFRKAFTEWDFTLS